MNKFQNMHIEAKKDKVGSNSPTPLYNLFYNGKLVDDNLTQSLAYAKKAGLKRLGWKTGVFKIEPMP